MNARVLSRKRTPISQWMAVIEKEVILSPNSQIETYHCITQADYVAVLAVLPDGRIPVVQQFRPCVEEMTWELPGELSFPPKFGPLVK